MPVILAGLVGVVSVLLLICWLIGRLMVYLTELPYRKSRVSAKQRAKQKRKENEENANNRKVFEEEVARLQLKYEESEFVKLLFKLIEQDKPYGRDFVYDLEYDGLKRIGWNKWYHFKNLDYEPLPDREHWLACAKALVKKLGPNFELYLKDWDNSRAFAADYVGPQIHIRYVGAKPLKKTIE